MASKVLIKMLMKEVISD